MNTGTAEGTPDPAQQSLRRHAASAAPTPRGAPVIAGLGYLRPMTGRPYNYMYQPPDGAPWQNCQYDLHDMPISDARSLSAPPSLHREGFELLDAPSAVADFLDEDAVVTRYYGEVAELALAVTGGSRAYVFDHLVRKREANRPPLSFGRHGDGSKPAAVGRVHNDYTEESGRKRLGLVFTDPDAVASVGRFCIVNIWRSIRGQVLDTPLAVCDARTVSVFDLVPAEVRYPTRTGEIYLCVHSRRHSWAYFPTMECNEVLIFKQYDSQISGVSRYTPHAAFDHPQTPPDAPLRESIEVRCLVVYE